MRIHVVWEKTKQCALSLACKGFWVMLESLDGIVTVSMCFSIFEKDSERIYTVAYLVDTGYHDRYQNMTRWWAWIHPELEGQCYRYPISNILCKEGVWKLCCDDTFVYLAIRCHLLDMWYQISNVISQIKFRNGNHRFSNRSICRHILQRKAKKWKLSIQ